MVKAEDPSVNRFRAFSANDLPANNANARRGSIRMRFTEDFLFAFEKNAAVRAKIAVRGDLFVAVGAGSEISHTMLG